MDIKNQHNPVMLAEVIEQLAIKRQGIYLDCTFGRGGHSQAILEKLGSAGRLIALDRDFAAISSEHAKTLLSDPRFSITHSRFSALEYILVRENLMGQVDGILLDLGVSSPQLDDPTRGFSFMHNGPLDMRMDCTAEQSAAEWLAQVEEKDLIRVLFEYGEERFARRIARAVVETRREKPIQTTRDLAELIEAVVPKLEKHKHPATRTFQAIRIEINKELDEVRTVLHHAMSALKQGGRMVVISFHSLEDRIVKQFIHAESGAKYDPGKLPIRESEISKGLLIKQGKAIKASKVEVEQNPRARSAIMRVAERI